MKRFSLKGFLKEEKENKEYLIKVLGSVLCSHPGAEEICRAIGEKYTASRGTIDKIPRQNMTISSKGIQLEKGLTGSEGSIKKFVIERIVYCGVDKQHQKIFAFFYRAPDNLYGGLDCHVIECRSKRDAKHIALTFSETFHQMAEEKKREIGETSLDQLNVVRERAKSVSMMQLHSSIESLSEADSCPGSPKIERSVNSRKLNYSELQLHVASRCENSSGYGDSSDDLTHKISSKTKRKKHKASSSEKTVQLKNNNRKTSDIGQVKMDYVNSEIAWSGHVHKNNDSSDYGKKIEHETLLSGEVEEWSAQRKDRNDNLCRKKFTINHEYMNMKREAPE
ncbi:low density lipoprotein receptor adapter protein 1-like [Dendronephthya gigantea]|uniref:low density lipoprotein receptor adapter protein 1-like n=1 Tax=Dendronephthya gigantea TaxID=151771 RepID=UPI00106A26FC|nr:low density lipoprotein receptor adapter protein 1-like [Dendronephthya gigantea]